MILTMNEKVRHTDHRRSPKVDRQTDQQARKTGPGESLELADKYLYNILSTNDLFEFRRDAEASLARLDH